MWEFLQPYLLEIIAGILTALAAYIGKQIKKIYEEKVNTEIKEKVVTVAVNAVEQIYKELKGEEKLDKCLEAATEMLVEKGIVASELELRMLIESVVNGFNKGKEK